MAPRGPEGVDDLAGWARTLDVSREACELVAASDVVDLHLDTFIWHRILGYDMARRHGHGITGARFLSQADLPRLHDGGVSSALWSITTNPLRRAEARATTFAANLQKLQHWMGHTDGIRHVGTVAEHHAARAAGEHAGWITIQGANAIDADPDLVATIADSVCLITLVHLSTSSLGTTSAPDPRNRGTTGKGLTGVGKEFVTACNAAGILVDLAHIHPDGFWDAVAVHDPNVPLVDSHTGVDACHLHWRNIDDDQILAVARTGGTVGIMYQCSFLGGSWWGDDSAHRVFAHLAHVVNVAGEDHASLGSDWDGAICPPRDMPTVLELPVLTQHMLDAGWTHERIAKVLGGNALRVLGTVRP